MKFQEMVRLRMKGKLLTSVVAFSMITLVLLYAYSWQPTCSLSYLTDSSIAHIFEYCNFAKQHHLEQEGTVPTAQYKLESVHVAIRHGDRTNLHSIKNYKSITVGCRITEGHGVMMTVPEMEGYVKFMQSQPQRTKDQSFSGWDFFPNKEVCEPSELTPRGASQHVHNGLFMKKRYIDNLKLLDEGSLYEEVLVRSTSFTRTFQSSLAFVYGLLGEKFDVSKLNIEEANTNMLCYERKGALSCDCPYIRPFINTMSPTYHQLHSDVMSNRKTVKVIDHFAEIFNVPSGKVPKLSNVMDFSMVNVCNKATLPGMIDDKGKKQCVSSWAVRDIYDTIQENGKKQRVNADYQKISRLKCLPLLDEIKNRMLQQAKGETPLKFVLYSGHDTSIDALSIALNFSKGQWPPYASKLVLELYSSSVSKSGSLDLFIRVLYNGQVVTTEMEFCKNHIHTDGVGYETGLCPFKIFEQYVNSSILKDISETSYDSACKQSSFL